MSTLRYLICLTVIPVVAAAADSPRGRDAVRAECIDQIGERTAALSARDWLQLERLAVRDANQCKGSLSLENYSRTHEQRALANNRLGFAKKAAFIAETCISLYYTNSGCHLQRAIALLDLGRVAEAKTSLDRTARLIQHLIDVAGENLKTATEPGAKEYLAARLEELEAQADNVSAIRERSDIR